MKRKNEGKKPDYKITTEIAKNLNLTPEHQSYYSDKSRSYSRKSSSHKQLSPLPQEDNIEYDDKDYKKAKKNLKKFLQSNVATPFIQANNGVSDNLKTSIIAFTLDKKSIFIL